MARQTSKSYRNLVLYSVYVRNYSNEGTFKSLQNDLDRIQNLGVDIIWLLPVHPIGKIARKGTMGSPYAICDYRQINPEYGTLEDFTLLVDAIHSRGMKCIIDVVYNHTSPDSLLVQNHPEWFYRREDSSFGNKIGEWPDVIDLDYSHNGLWEYQIDTLKQWAQIIDGFRCDVAPLIPLEFWLEARRQVELVKPDCIWIAESVEPVFTVENRARGLISLSDSELYQAFDICYDYDIFAYFKGYLNRKNSLAVYSEKINQQESIYPDNYVKLRFLENHDQERAKLLLPNESSLRNWTAFLYFQKGMTLIYAGQEAGDSNRPSLFDKDAVKWENGCDLSSMMARLYAIKKNPLFTNSRYEVKAIPGEVLYATHRSDGCLITGVFSMHGQRALIPAEVPDGVYINLIDGGKIPIRDGFIACSGNPIIFESVREDAMNNEN